MLFFVSAGLILLFAAMFSKPLVAWTLERSAMRFTGATRSDSEADCSEIELVNGEKDEMTPVVERAGAGNRAVLGICRHVWREAALVALNFWITLAIFPALTVKQPAQSLRILGLRLINRSGCPPLRHR